MQTLNMLNCYENNVTMQKEQEVLKLGLILFKQNALYTVFYYFDFAVKYEPSMRFTQWYNRAEQH